MNFGGRINKSREAVEAFDNYCNKMGWIYAKTGYEDMLSSSDKFMDKIKSLGSDTAMRLRFFPDRVVVNNFVRLTEVKHSKTIEKTAYDIYMDLYNISYDVGIAFYMLSLKPLTHEFEFRFCKINELIIREVNDWQKENNDVPIIDNKWFAPRELLKIDPEKYNKWKRATGGSGTTYGYVDFINSNFEIWEL